MALLQNVIARGTHASRPAAGSAGIVYFETDTGQLFRDSGSAWQLIDVTSLFATKGDLLVGTGSGTVAKLAAGTDTYVLTADSAQTDGIKWAAAAGGGAVTELADSVVSGSVTTTVTFSSISGSYTSLLIALTARCDEATGDDYAKMRFNGDTGSTYDYKGLSITGSTFSTQQNGATAGTSIGGIDVPGSTATSGAAASGVLWIPNYTDTTFWKGSTYQAYVLSGTTATLMQQGGAWRSTAAITQIDLIAPASSHWVSGSHFRLFGVN